jgi:diguanylate cyclase (GGDEF)-like protein
MSGRPETVERLREAVISLERSRRRERELRAAHEGLLDVLRVLAMADHREETFESLLGVLRSVLPFEDAAVLVRAAEGEAFTPAARTAEWLSAVHLTPGPMLARVVDGETVVMFDATLADEWRAQAPEVRARCRSVIHVPLRSGPRPVLLVCTHTEPARFEQRHVEVIKRIVPLAGQILQKLDMREVLSAREAQRHARLATLSAIVDHIQAGILVEDDQRRVFAVNQVLREMFVGHGDADGAVGGDAVALHARFAFLAEQPDAFVRRTRELAEARVPVSGDEIRLHDGRVVERDYVPVATPDAGFVAHFWQYRDVTARRSLEEQLRRQAYEDALTGLPNRARFTEELGAVLRTLRRHPSRRASVLFIDLDGFKAVNDRLGHAAGDELLVAFVDRLRRCVRDTDVVARRGGDEFTVLLVEVGAGAGEELRVAQRILDALARPFSLAGQACTITASIGVATCTPAHASADDVVRDADAAMYRAKAAGKGCYRTFLPVCSPARQDADDALGAPPDRGRALRSMALPPNAAERLVDRARKS